MGKYVLICININKVKCCAIHNSDKYIFYIFDTPKK